MNSILKIPLTRGKFAIVDEDGYNKVNEYKWHCNTNYASGYVTVDNTKKHLYMHRFLMGSPSGMLIDHINGDGLDNRFCNLRICNKSQNAANRHSIYGKSKYIGVVWYKKDKKWAASITCNYVSKHLGSFDCEVDAAIAYNKAALEIFGEFATQNKIII